MEYKDKTRKYRVITPYLILLFFILTIPEISKAQTDQEYLQGLIDNAKVNQQLDIDLRGKTYTVSSLTISNDNGDKSHYKTILLTNGRIVQSKGKNNGSLIMIKDNSTLLLRNITISGSGDEAKNSLIYIDEGNGSAGLCIYEGTIIEKGFVSNDVYASCIRVGTGSLFIEGVKFMVIKEFMVKSVLIVVAVFIFGEEVSEQYMILMNLTKFSIIYILEMMLL